MGERRIINGAIYEKTPQGIVLVGPAEAAPVMPSAVPLPVNPVRAAREAQDQARKDAADARAERREDRTEANTARDIENDSRTANNQHIANIMKLRGDWDALPAVKEYRTAISQLATGLRTSDDATGDNALIYAYAKAMDPGSVVRESEMGMAASGASVFDSVTANLKKQFGIEGGGQLSPEVRDHLRREMGNKVAQLNRIYKVQRSRFQKDAKAFGLDPERIVGPHDGDQFMPIIKEYQARQKADNELPNPTNGAETKPPVTDEGAPPLKQRPIDPKTTAKVNSLISQGAWEMANQVLRSANAPAIEPIEKQQIQAWQKNNPGAPYTGAKIYQPTYQESTLGQGLSGLNEGLAGIMGAPVDLVTAVTNAATGGVNALANTDIGRIEKPILGSDWIKDLMGDQAIFAPTDDPTQQFVRRTGESIGAAAIPAGAAGSLGRAGAQLLAGAAGGVGGATAEQVLPGNPWAEIAGEMVAGAGASGGLVANARRAAQREIEAAVPTIPQLKEQAGDLYRSAEARGVTADPAMTQTLADNFRAALADEGLVSPTGRLSDVYPKAREAMQLVEDYAGQPMSPTQMQTVRKVTSDGLSSPDRTERRLGGILTDVVDEWVNPLAPELSEARDVASRYLTAEQLQQARELAGSRAGQFTGSGFENALRTEYRGLDRGAIKGSKRFGEDVTEAIEAVSRGTPTSNFFRGLGRFAPTGPMAMSAGAGVPAIAGGYLGGPLGAAIGGSIGVAGIAGRKVATDMGVRAADQAELVARNGGKLPEAVLPPELADQLRRMFAAQSVKYLTPER